MKKIICFLLLGIMISGILFGCTEKEAEIGIVTDTIEDSALKQTEVHTRTVTDWCGRKVEVPQKIKSVICVGVGTLRYTTYLQAQDLIVGVEEHEIGAKCTRPFSFVSQNIYKDLPLTGNNGKTFDEQIIAADPDVIVSFLNTEKADKLQKKVGIPVVTMPHLEGILDDEVFFALDFLGELYGRQERAQELRDYLNEIRTDIETRTANIKQHPTVYVAGVSFKGEHGFEGTESGYGPLEALGAVNIADDYGEGLPFDMDIEEVLRRDPDFIFISNEKLVKEQYAQNPGFYDSFSAVKQGKVYSQISYRNCATNTEMALANLYYMGTVLYPDQFKDIDPIEKTNEIIEKFLGAKNYYRILEEAGYRFEPITLGK